jgi:hypothetical protein
VQHGEPADALAAMSLALRLGLEEELIDPRGIGDFIPIVDVKR